MADANIVARLKQLKKDIKPGLIWYMEKKKPGLSPATYSTYAADSNYLLNNGRVDEYLRFVRSDEDMPELIELISKLLIEVRGADKMKPTDPQYYYEKLCWHKEYIKFIGGIDSVLGTHNLQELICEKRRPEMSDFKYEIKEEIAILSEGSKGWRKELNLISWNDGDPKYDIRDWSPDHEKMGKGITLTKEEAKQLYVALSQI